MAAAWLDDRQPDALFLARGVSRPLWIGRSETETFFASTRRALAIVEAAVGLRLQARPMREGRLLEVVAGRIARTRRFRADRGVHDEPADYSPVHSPHEAVSCLTRLSALATA
jgi:hypothetical protein